MFTTVLTTLSKVYKYHSNYSNFDMQKPLLISQQIHPPSVVLDLTLLDKPQQ